MDRMNGPGPPEISIVVPLFNEEGNVGPLCRAVREALHDWDRDWELVLVDDGSTDRTLELGAEEARGDRRVRMLRMKRNAGQTQAMAAGFARARGAIIVSMDGDLQNDSRDIPLLVSRIDRGYDVVCGWRKDRQDAWLSRTLPSKIANRLIAWVTGIPIHDNGCSLKAYRASVIRSIRLYSEMHRFLPAMSSMTGARIDEVVVRHHPRIHGESKYGIMRTFKVLNDMVVITMLTQFSNRPGVWFALLAVPFLVLGGVSAAVWLVQLSLPEARPSIVFPSVAVMFVYLFGHLMVLSILAEFLLARGDRDYFKRLSRVLEVSDTETVEPRGSGSR
jgi:glycosyltransferase involved in cell wall biosynthesis